MRRSERIEAGEGRPRCVSLLAQAANRTAGRRRIRSIPTRRLDREAIERRKRLTESRLAWEVMVEVMRGRDKVIIDADAPKGRRHLYLVDPEFLRPMPDRAERPGGQDGP